MRNIKKSLVVALMMIMVLSLVACGYIDSEASGGDVLEVHFIDVGQADSILIKKGDESMLIDAGNNSDGDLVVNYLKK